MTDETERIERTMRERLGAAADLAPARRRALLERIAPASARPVKRRTLPVWVWLGGAAAAAAAAVLVAVTLWPEKQPEPIAPTDLLGDLLGPLAAGAPAAQESPGPESPEEPSVGDAFAFFGQDFNGLVGLGRSALEAAQGVAARPTGPDNEPDVPRRRIR